MDRTTATNHRLRQGSLPGSENGKSKIKRSTPLHQVHHAHQPLPRYFQSHPPFRGDIDSFTPELEFRVDGAVKDGAVNCVLRVEGSMKGADRGVVYNLLQNNPET